jgi:hypothetical protein
MTTILNRLVRDQRIVVRMGSVLPRPTQLDMGVDQ